MDDLSHFFGAYLYEAWNEYEYRSWQEAVDDFVWRSPTRVSGAADQVRELVSLDIDDAELARRLQSLGFTDVPYKRKRVWLYLLLDRLSQQTASAPEGSIRESKSQSMDALPHLMGAYFHQDFDIDGGEPWHTVAAFLRERRELAERCVEEIDVLLMRPFPEGGLTARLDAWGCDFYAGDTDADYRRWLGEIRDQMRSFLRANPAP